MKRFVIKDLEDNQYFCDANTWSNDINDALMFIKSEDAWNKAITINAESKYAVTVIAIIY